VAEGMPPDTVVFASCSPSFVVSRQATSVRNRAVLPAPYTDSSTALGTRHKAESGRTDVILLNGSRMVVTDRDMAPKDQFEPHRWG